jgi:tetratricopeptide (TPR) repeat protein
MAQAFIVRPFGTKLDSSRKKVNFERVHRELIKPALEANDLNGDTTGEIVEAGNIREDMFQLILEADLVVCDITVHNANVFYELGIRHALRKKRTLLIKGDPTNDKTPFDLLTDRYFAYDIRAPAKSRDALAKAIKATMTADRVTDSPIFQMIPALPEADAERLQVVPADFQEEVRRAAKVRAKGWLRLLADEVRGLRFERSGLKLAGKAQWDAKDYDGARESWERVRKVYPNDVAANLALANIYERQGRDGRSRDERAGLLVRSDQAIERVLGNSSVTRKDMAEALALKGRNQKTHWRAAFQAAGSLRERRLAALSRSLIESYESYRDAFIHDLNHFYPGLGALQMGSILLDLSGEDRWKDVFRDDRAAKNYRIDLEEMVPYVRDAVRLSVRAALKSDPDDRWAKISEADVLFLADESENRVVTAYEDAFANSSPFDWDAARGQLALYSDLGLKPDRARAVIDAVEKGLMQSEARRPTHVVVFAGHQIDEPRRAKPRFPAGKEAQARALITAAMKQIFDHDQEFVGLGSASPGADVLWHEACNDLGLKTTVCLPMPAKDHARAVFKGYDTWRSRFLDLVEDKNRQVLTLSDREGLPKWLEGRRIDPWVRGNEWVMKMALTWGADKISLLAFWDGREQRVGTGGTAQVVQLARDAGNVRIVPIDSRQILA